MKAPASHFYGQTFPAGFAGTFSAVDGFGWLDILSGSYRDGFATAAAAVCDAARHASRK